MTLNVLSVASEIYPIIKTGGLADVTGALPGALRAEDIAVTTLVPGYPAVLRALADASVVLTLPDLFGGPARVLAGRAAGLDLFAIDAPHLFDRPGNPYVGPDGQDWPDNPFRFAALARIGAELGRGVAPGYAPDIVHGHDWQAGLVCAYLRYGAPPRPRAVFTIHNLAFQGQVPSFLLAALGLPPEAYAIDGVEYYSAIGYLKAGVALADRVTTVSPSYAAEITTEAGGMGIGGLLRARASVLSGILNGIDTQAWNPAEDPLLAANFDAGQLQTRTRNTAALQARLGLDADPDALVFCVVSRLTWQKGLDLLLDSLPSLLGTGAQLAVLGAGDPALQAGFAAAAAANPGRIACVFGYDESLAHLIQGGAHAILIPSRFEPCGLTQLYALRYGAVPVVARVGGLADSVVDANEAALAAGVATGVQFAPVSAEALRIAILRTAALFRDVATWRALQRNGMRADVSWRRPAQHYARLFSDLVAAGAA